MSKFRITKNPGQDASNFFVGRDSHSLFMQTTVGDFVVLVGCGCWEGFEGRRLSRSEVERGKDVRVLPVGTTLELTV